MNIANKKALQITSLFIQGQLDLTDATNLATVAKDLAVIAGLDSSEATKTLTTAILTQRPMLLKQFGIVQGLDQIYADYAETVGKSASNLTSLEKRQAFLNTILSEGEKVAGTYEAAMGSVSKRYRSLTGRILPDFIEKVGKAFEPGLIVIIDAITATIGRLEKNLKSATEFYIKHKGAINALVLIITGVFVPALIGIGIQMGINLVKSIASATLNLFKFGLEGWKTVAMLIMKASKLAISSAAFIFHTTVTIAQTVAQIALTAATWLFNVALAVLTSPIFLVVLAIVALIAIGVALWKNWDVIKEKANILWSNIKAGWNTLVNFLRSTGNRVRDAIVRPFSEAWNKVQEIVRKIKDALDFTKRQSPSVVDIVKRGVGQVNKAMEGLEFNTNLTPRVTATALAPATSGTNLTQVTVNLPGAIISNEAAAQEISEIIGDHIIRKVQANVRT